SCRTRARLPWCVRMGSEFTARVKDAAKRLAGEPGRRAYRRLYDGAPGALVQSAPTPAPPVGGATAGATSATLRPARPPPGHRGQLADAAQHELAASRAQLTLADCDFYHATTLPDGTDMQGAWDLRGREGAYLGNVEFRDQRVIEIGPASGGLTFWMERAGADVVAFDVGYDVTMDLMPFNGAALDGVRADHMRALEPVQ